MKNKRVTVLRTIYLDCVVPVELPDEASEDQIYEQKAKLITWCDQNGIWNDVSGYDEEDDDQIIDIEDDNSEDDDDFERLILKCEPVSDGTVVE